MSSSRVGVSRRPEFVEFGHAAERVVVSPRCRSLITYCAYPQHAAFPTYERDPDATRALAFNPCSACILFARDINRLGIRPARADLLRLETALNEGVMHRDRAALERLLAEEFGLSQPDRSAAARDRWLANVEQISVRSYRISEPQITVWGDVAVVRTHQHFENWQTGGSK